MHKVRELTLLLRTNGPGESSLRPRAEKFVADILEQLGDRLERQFPGRVILIRNLPLRWCLTEPQLGTANEITKAVDQVAGALDDYVWPEIYPPREDEEVIIFENESHWRASFVVAASLGNQANAWYFNSLNHRETPWSFARRSDLTQTENAQRLVDNLMLLAKGNKLVEVLGSTSGSDLAWMATVLNLSKQEEWAGSPTVDLVYPAVDRAGQLPDAAQAEAHDDYVYPHEEGILRDRIARWVIDQLQTQETMQASSSHAAHKEVRNIAYSKNDDSEVASSAEPSAVNQFEDFDRVGIKTHSTRFAGLFYLLRIALELDVGEILWKACLPEGSVLFGAAKRILGQAGIGDPAAQLFGDPALSEFDRAISKEQVYEISASLLSSLVQAIPRRGLAKWPSTRIQVINAGSTRLLTVIAENHLLFSWPVLTVLDLRDGIGLFMSCWPKSAPTPTSTPDLVPIDDSGRLMCGLNGAKATESETSPIASLNDAVVAQVAGSMLMLFTARLERDSHKAHCESVAAVLNEPGTIQVKAEEVCIRMPMASINLQVRKAGLDQNPGWVPWLHANCKIEFV